MTAAIAQLDGYDADRVHIDDPMPGADEDPVQEASPAAAYAACR